MLVLVTLLVVHLFLPEHLTKYDPLDRLYRRIDPVVEPKKPKTPPPAPPGSDTQP
jgi:hypothetical protein